MKQGTKEVVGWLVGWGANGLERGKKDILKMELLKVPLPMLRDTASPLAADQEMGHNCPTVTLPHVMLMKSAEVCAIALATSALSAERRRERCIVCV